MRRYVAYYRVSTKRQGESGLGLEAQRTAVRQFTGCMDGSCIDGEFTDVESGKNDRRPELAKALHLCQELGATLVIAKLDRLSRNMKFIVDLQEAKVKFVCCDMPEANEFTIHIFAAMAQHERKIISERTKAGLKSKQERIAAGNYVNAKLDDSGRATAMKPDKNGVYRLGNPEGWSADKRAKAIAAIKDKAASNRNTKLAIRRVAECLRAAPKSSLSELADRLNEYGLRTPSGKAFARTNVQYIRRKALELMSAQHQPDLLSQ